MSAVPAGSHGQGAIRVNASTSKRIVVTGAGGFIGSHLCEALIAQGHDVLGLEGFVDSYGRHYKEANLAGLATNPQFSFAAVDLRDDDLAPHLAGADVVVHEAAMPGLPRSWTDVELYIGCNLLATQRLLEAARAAGVSKFVQASTSSVYGLQATGDETLPTRPVSPYGVTKLAAEHLVRAYASTYGLPAVILRYFSIYGPRQRPDMAYHLFTEAMLRGKPITVFGDGRQSRSNTFVDDCVRGTVLAIHGARVGETYNIGGGQSITLLEAIHCIADVLGVSPQVSYSAPRPGDQLHTSADTGKAHATFGYAPAVDPHEGLRAQVAWHLARNSSSRPTADPAQGSVVRSTM